MAILSQLMTPDDLKALTPEDLRHIILKLDEQIANASAGEKILVSLHANVVGVMHDRPAGANVEVVTKAAGELEDWQKAHVKTKSAKTKAAKAK